MHAAPAAGDVPALSYDAPGRYHSGVSNPLLSYCAPGRYISGGVSLNETSLPATPAHARPAPSGSHGHAAPGPPPLNSDLEAAYALLGLDRLWPTILPPRPPLARPLRDGHLLLGVTRAAAFEMHREVMIGYNRASWVQETGRGSFIGRNYGDDSTGYDTAEAVKRWLGARGYHYLSMAEAWLLLGRGGVGKATMFVSHTQREPFETTMAANGRPIGDEELLWIDYFVLRQLDPRGDFDPPAIHAVIAHVQNTLAIEDGEAGAATSYLVRSFCLFEVACTPPSHLHFPMSERRQEIAGWDFSRNRRVAFAFVGLASLGAACWQIQQAVLSWGLAFLVSSVFLLVVVVLGYVYAQSAGSAYTSFNNGRFQKAGRWVCISSVVLLALAFALTLWGTLQAHGNYDAGLRGFGLLLLCFVSVFVLAVVVELDRVALRVDAKRAECTRLADKEFVDAYIEDNLGGFHQVNRQIKQTLAASLRDWRFDVDD